MRVLGGSDGSVRGARRLASVVLPLLLVASACDWTMFMGGPAHTGTANKYEVAISADNVGGMTEAWSTPTTSLVLSVVVVNGMSYVADNTTIRAYDSAGIEVWNHPSGSTIFSTPAVVNGVLYFNNGQNGLNALDANTGAFMWKSASQFFDYSSPVVVNHTVYAGGRGFVYAFTDDGSGCVDLTKCQPVRKYQAGNAGNVNPIVSSPAIAAGYLYVGGLDGKMYAFKLGAPCVEDPQDHIPSCTAARLYNPGDSGGTILGSSPTVANPSPDPNSDVRDVFIGTNGGALVAFSADGTTNCDTSTPQNCTPLWRTVLSTQNPPPAGANAVAATAAVAGGRAYITGADDRLYTFDATTGTLLWTATLSGIGTNGRKASPAVANGLVYLGSENKIGGTQGSHRFEAFDANGCSGPGIPNCDPLWHYDVAGSASSAAIANGTVYVGGGNHIYAFKP